MALSSPHIHVEDTPSETVRLTRRQLNNLVSFVIDMFVAAGAAGSGDDWRTAVAALDPTPLRQVLASFERPVPPQFPTP